MENQRWTNGERRAGEEIHKGEMLLWLFSQCRASGTTGAFWDAMPCVGRRVSVPGGNLLGLLLLLQ